MRPAASIFLRVRCRRTTAIAAATATADSLLPYTGRERARADRRSGPSDGSAPEIRMQINKSHDMANGPSTPSRARRRAPLVRTLIALRAASRTFLLSSLPSLAHTRTLPCPFE